MAAGKSHLRANLDYIAEIWILLFSDKWAVGWCRMCLDGGGVWLQTGEQAQGVAHAQHQGQGAVDQVVSSPSSLSLLPGTIVIIAGCSDD